MGEIADYDFDEGILAWQLHQAGECGPDICQYCEEELDEENKPH